MENSDKRFWLLVVSLLGLMVISLLMTGCSANTALCPAYDHPPIVKNGYVATHN